MLSRTVIPKEDMTSMQVVLALVFLLIFGLSFGVTFEYFSLAKNSVEAHIVGPVNCGYLGTASDGNFSCTTSSTPFSSCHVVLVNASYEDVSFQGDRVLLQFYHDYYSAMQCSFTMCGPSGSGKQSERRLKFEAVIALNNTQFPCWVDLTKPATAFLELEDSGSNKHFFSKVKGYFILVVPPLAMSVSVIALIGCIIAGKVRARELLEPVLTPNHVEVDGKWYLRTPKASPVEPEEKWQQLKEALELPKPSPD